MIRLIRPLPAVILLAAVAACSAADAVPDAEGTPTGRIDSILPPQVALNRFLGAEPRVAGLQGGAPSIDSLVSLWLEAVAVGDTAAVRRLVLSRAEFGSLYYPESGHAGGPLYQPPEILWLRVGSASEKGIVRVLRRLGGQPLVLAGVDCRGDPRDTGLNRIHEYCEVRYLIGETMATGVLFGGIIERDGEFKFVSYGNQY